MARLVAAVLVAACGVAGGVLIATLGPNTDHRTVTITALLAGASILSGLAAAERIANGDVSDEDEDCSECAKVDAD